MPIDYTRLQPQTYLTRAETFISNLQAAGHGELAQKLRKRIDESPPIKAKGNRFYKHREARRILDEYQNEPDYKGHIPAHMPEISA